MMREFPVLETVEIANGAGPLKIDEGPLVMRVSRPRSPREKRNGMFGNLFGASRALMARINPNGLFVRR